MALSVIGTNNNSSLVLDSHTGSIGSISNLSSNNNVNIDFNGHNSVLTLTGTAYNATISDPNSTGTIHINPDLNITLNGRVGTSEHPVSTLVVGNNSTLTITDHLYVNSVTLGDGASIVPPAMMHVMGDNLDVADF